MCERQRNTGPLRVLCGITGREDTLVLVSEAAKEGSRDLRAVTGGAAQTFRTGRSRTCPAVPFLTCKS